MNRVDLALLCITAIAALLQAGYAIGGLIPQAYLAFGAVGILSLILLIRNMDKFWLRFFGIFMLGASALIWAFINIF